MFVDQEQQLCQTILKSQKCNFPINMPAVRERVVNNSQTTTVNIFTYKASHAPFHRSETRKKYTVWC